MLQSLTRRPAVTLRSTPGYGERRPSAKNKHAWNLVEILSLATSAYRPNFNTISEQAQSTAALWQKMPTEIGHLPR